MLSHIELLIDRSSVVFESTAIKILYDSIAANGYFWCALEMCDFEMPFRKIKKGEKQRENTAPTILASKLHYCSLEIKTMPLGMHRDVLVHLFTATLVKWGGKELQRYYTTF